MTFGQKALLGGLISFFALLGVVTTASYKPLDFLEEQVFLRMNKKQVEAPTPKNESLQLVFVGDIMLDRYIRTVSNRRGQDFLIHDSIRGLLKEGDMVIGNLEGPITDEPSQSETSRVGEAKNYHFTFPVTSAQFLERSGIRTVNLGNNHILNFGEEGATKTESYLQASGIKYFGSPLADNERISYQEIKGIKIALVNYNEFLYQGKEKTLADLASVKTQVDIVVLYAHWGAEYEGVAEDTRVLAHQFIEAGADLIMGSHPHVIQESEEYQGKRIYYSLGNFIFDQYFSPETKEGLLVQVIFDPQTREMVFEEKRVVLSPNGQTSLAPEDF